MRERDYTGWLFVVFMLIALAVAVWGDKPLQKTYKNGYEVVKIGNCEYLRDWGMFHETLVHDGECKNHTK